jgi:hypothetical protein
MYSFKKWVFFICELLPVGTCDQVFHIKKEQEKRLKDRMYLVTSNNVPFLNVNTTEKKQGI